MRRVLSFPTCSIITNVFPIIELDHQSFGTHAYLNSIKSNENREFCRDYEYYVEKYALR